jgi:hypothetical protein
LPWARLWTRAGDSSQSQAWRGLRQDACETGSGSVAPDVAGLDLLLRLRPALLA